MTRLTDLEEIRAGLVERMAVASSDQNYAVMGRLLADVVKQIDELGDGVENKGTALDELAARRRAAGRPDASGVVGAQVSGQ